MTLTQEQAEKLLKEIEINIAKEVDSNLEQITDNKGRVGYLMSFYLTDVDTLEYSEQRYRLWETIISMFQAYLKDTDKYEFSITYDVSGYDYWTVRQEESNYLDLGLYVYDELSEEEIGFITDVFDKLTFTLEDIDILEGRLEVLRSNLNYVYNAFSPVKSVAHEVPTDITVILDNLLKR